MKTKLFFLMVFFLMINLVVTSGDRNSKRYNKLVRQMDASTLISYAPYNTNPESVVFLPMILAGAFQTDSISVGPEISTGLSGFYDYKTNGEANMYIQVDPTDPLKVHAIDTYADSTDAAGSTTRRTLYTFSEDGGNTWVQSLEVPTIRSGFGVLDLRSSAAVIANHNTAINNYLDAMLYVDIAPLAGTFTEYGHPSQVPFGIWPQIAVYNDGNVGLVSRRNVSSAAPPETLFYSVWNGTTLSARTPLYITGLNFIGSVGSNMRFHLETNGAGRVTAIIAPVLQNDTLENSKVFERTSTDNGVTWGPVNTVFAPHTVNGGADTVATAGGSGFTYKKNTNTWIYAYPITNDNLYSEARLVATNNNGQTSVIATAVQLGATFEYVASMSFVFNIDFPALGWSADGSTLYCVYSVTMPDTSRGYNQRDIFCSYSLDDGTTWSNPKRLTNTPDIDESYPSISTWNPGTPGNSYEAYITYMKDLGVGPTSFGGSAPASRNTLIFRKLTGESPIGIYSNQNLLKDYHLTQNYPNPFNPSTKIEYNIVKSGLVTLKIYNVLGKEVATLVNEVQNTGVKSVEFNAANFPSGVYFYTLVSGDFNDTKKMILIK
jgi:hypothetical protein